MDYLNIDGYRIPYPNGFTIEKQLRKAAAYTTMNGTEIADVVGWKYADAQLKWDTLLDADLRNLLLATASSVIELTFEGLDGETVTEQAIVESCVNTKTRFRDSNNRIVWKDITVSLSFPKSH